MMDCNRRWPWTICIGLGAMLGVSPAWALAGADAPLLPAAFAGEAMVVALAFSLPALLAGAYLGVQRMTARYGVRTLVAAMSVVAIGTGIAWFAPEHGTALLQWAGIGPVAQ